MAKKTTRNRIGGKNNKLIAFMIVGLLLFLAGTFTFNFFQNLYQTETYYVLKENVPTRTQITPDMMEAVTTTAGTAPKAAIGISDIQTGNVYSQYPLTAGDILTQSNIGGMKDISVGVPDNWVITNFSVNADNAVGGRIKRGTYFDIMITAKDNKSSFYPFVNMLALDTTVSLNSASSSDAANTDEAHAGQTSQYVVGLTPKNAAYLQSLMAEYGSGNVRLVLSPRQNEYKKPQLSDYNGMFNYETDKPGTIWPGQSSNGEATDYTFRDVQRDEFGRPKEKAQNCSEGNAKISGKVCEAPSK